MAEQTVAQLKSDLKKFEEWVAEARRTKTQQKEDRKAENLRRRLNPRTEKDFELVWHALEQWREEQVIFWRKILEEYLWVLAIDNLDRISGSPYFGFSNNPPNASMGRHGDVRK